MDILLLGAPGAGKGTQAELLMRWLPWPQVSTGMLFRAAMAASSALGEHVRGYVERGELVPDSLTLEIVRDRLAERDCDQGAILDGFPRTLAQARGLKKLLADNGRWLGLAAYIEVPVPALMERLAGRWMCRKCGAIHHTLLNESVATGLCQACGGELYQREDDTPAVLGRRIEVYLEQTAPLVDYYHSEGLLVSIDGRPEPVAVQRALRQAVLERLPSGARAEALRATVEAGLSA